MPGGLGLGVTALVGSTALGGNQALLLPLLGMSAFPGYLDSLGTDQGAPAHPA